MSASSADALVSVVIPTYNRSELLGFAVESALAQTYSHIEVVIVDDGSTDDTLARVSSFDTARVRCITKPNGGASSARNVGVAAARGEFVGFLDSDDAWHPEWVGRALTAMAAAGRDFGAAYGGIQFIDAQRRPVRQLDLSAGGTHREMDIPYALSRVPGVHGLGSNVIVRREAAVAAGPWDESLPTAEDLDFGLRLAAVTRLAIVPEPLILVRHTEGSLSGRVGTGNRLKVLDKLAETHPRLMARHGAAVRAARAGIMASYGEDLLWKRDFPAAASLLRRSLALKASRRALWLLVKTQLLKAGARFSSES